MADRFRPLRLGTIMRFGSLEFMTLGIGYDMVLLPARDDAEPCLEPLPPQLVRGRPVREPGAVVRGPGSLTPPLKPGLFWLSPRTFLIRSPIPLAHAVLGESPVELQALP